MSITEIHIRKLRWAEARRKLEDELNNAFVSGQRHVRVVHGIGMYRLKALTSEVVAELGLGRVLPDLLSRNPGTTDVELQPPPDQVLRWHLK